MIQVKNLSKFYGNHRAIESVVFSIDEGSIVGLLGLNGAGKSTILKILATYLTPTQGSICVDGQDYTGDLSQLRQVIGYLPDRPPLYDEMRVDDYLRFVARLRGVSGDKLDSYLQFALESTSLIEERRTHLSELSHGFRQRVGIAQAIIHRPKLLILDEPINGLDPVQIVEMRDLILSLKGPFTVVLSSHILSEITQTCDKIIILDRGRVVAEGTEKELRGGQTGLMTVKMEWRGTSELIRRQLEAIAGVQNVDLIERDHSYNATIKTEGDLRGTLAATVIHNEGELLGLNIVDQGLEDLFMKLVQKGAH